MLEPRGGNNAVRIYDEPAELLIKRLQVRRPELSPPRAVARSAFSLRHFFLGHGLMFFFFFFLGASTGSHAVYSTVTSVQLPPVYYLCLWAIGK